MEINITITGLNNNKALEILNLLNGEQVTSAFTATAPAFPSFNIPVPPATPADNDDEDNTSNDVSVQGQVDSENLPWDARIHSSNMKKKSDGTWAKRRGVQEPEIKAVEAELRGGTSANVAAAMAAFGLQTTVQAAPIQPIAAPVQLPVAQAVSVQPIVATAPAAVVQPIVAPVQAPVGRDFQGVMTRIQRGCAAGKIDLAWINQNIVGAINAQTVFGVQMSSVVDMQMRPDIVDYTHQILDVNGL